MAAVEHEFLSQPLTGGGGRLLASPFQFWTTGEEHLRVESACSVPDVVVALHYRFLDPELGIIANVDFHRCTADRVIARSHHRLGKGALLNLTAFAHTGEPRVGQCFVRVQLVRGFSGALIVMGTLLQSYVTHCQDVAWPGSPIALSSEGGGCVRQVFGTIPAAQAEISETVPTGAMWQVLSFLAPLVTSALVGPRTPILLLGPSASLHGLYLQWGTQAASQSLQFGWGGGITLEAVANNYVRTGAIPMGLTLLAGDKVGTFTPGILAGDQWGQANLCVREWLDVA